MSLSSEIAVSVILLLLLVSVVVTCFHGFAGALASAQSLGRWFLALSRKLRLMTVLVAVSFLCLGTCGVYKSVVQGWRERPAFVDPPAHVLASGFQLSWVFDAPLRAGDQFVLTARDAADQKVLFTHRTESASYNVGDEFDPGLLSFRVALHRNGLEYSASREMQIEVHADSLARFKSTGELIVGVHIDKAVGLFCYELMDLEGFDIDLCGWLVKRLAEEHSVPSPTVSYVHYEWPQVLAQPAAHTVDFSIASISRTDEREARWKVKFSEPYHTTRIGVLQRSTSEGSSSSTPLHATKLAGKIGVHTSTTTEKFLKKIVEYQEKHGGAGVDPVYAKDNRVLLNLLEAGEVDYVLSDFERAQFQAMSVGALRVRSLVYDPLAHDDERYALALSNENESLLAELNKLIKGHPEIIGKFLEKRVEGRRAN